MSEHKKEEEAAIASFRRWLDGFNKRDVNKQINEMHFPHHRLAGSKLNSWETAKEWADGNHEISQKLYDEGWHHTSLVSLDVVQSNKNKVHITLRMSRRGEDDTEYNGFDTLWIFTKVGGIWGAKLRSSYLSGATQLEGTKKED